MTDEHTRDPRADDAPGPASDGEHPETRPDGESPEATADGDGLLYVEDLTVGQTWEPGRVTFTEEEILAFAEEFDPQPIHADPEAAERHFDGVIASGWHTAAACMRPFATEVLSEVAVVAALGIDDLRWHAPVYPGDTLSVEVSVVDTEPWNDQRGKVTFGVEATDEDGERVHSRKDLVLVERRTPDAVAGSGGQ